MGIEPKYASGLKLLGGRKFVGMLVVAAFMLLTILLVFLHLPHRPDAWRFLELAWPGFLMLVGFYMGADVADKVLQLRSGRSSESTGEVKN